MDQPFLPEPTCENERGGKVNYRSLGPYSDLVDYLQPAWSDPVRLTSEDARRMLGVQPHSGVVDIRKDQSWSHQGVTGVAMSWSVGYGPRTEGWLLRPQGVESPLPGVLALHDHGGFKSVGKGKIADGPSPTPHHVQEFRDQLYAGEAFANRLARRGFAVLVADVMPWGSRRFGLETMSTDDRQWAESVYAQQGWRTDWPKDESVYNLAAIQHEHVLEKYLRLMGSSLASRICQEDIAASEILQTYGNITPQGIGCIGLSGGGARSVLLSATCQAVRAAVVVGMMSTFEGLFDEHVHKHTWLFFPPEIARVADWSDLAAVQAPAPLLVQYNEDDPLFSKRGMRAADQRLRQHYDYQHALSAYEGKWYPGPHKFNRDMQDDAFTWLGEQLC